ncbi:hypothetical protein LBMAG53_20910 [Planctomycetota bacterium]|nr:hypothetical protein LBMAG53_20910 [Planctomycetota bacterium]
MRPLRFLVNPASGGRQGLALLRQLDQLAPGRVTRTGAIQLPELLAHAAGEGGALVACGGDGTAASLLEAGAANGTIGRVPVGIIPLGTGNDLARCLGWLNAGTPAQVCQALATAPITRIDRWLLHGPSGTRSFFNYLSIGADARIVAAFQRARSLQPWLVTLPGVGKALYGALGAMIAQPPLGRAVEWPTAQGIPDWAAALVVASIPSYAGGARLARAIAADDGRLDAFALPGGMSLGAIVAKVRRPRGLAFSPTFRLRWPMLAQFDGEPHRLPAGPYRIERAGMVPVLVRPSAVLDVGRADGACTTQGIERS